MFLISGEVSESTRPEPSPPMEVVAGLPRHSLNLPSDVIQPTLPAG
jgi:hypothetical protein